MNAVRTAAPGRAALNEAGNGVAVTGTGHGRLATRRSFHAQADGG